MSITIHEALEFESFKGFKIIAGNKGLSNKITNVGILDYEMGGLIEENFIEGEFVISTLMVIKDNIEELYKIVEKMISVKISGLAIKSVYFNTIPDEVIELADKNFFPIMIFSDTYFEHIITEVAKAIEDRKENEALSLKIDNILYSNLDNLIIKKIAHEINRNFKEKNIVAFCKRKGKEKLIHTKIFFSKEDYKSLNKIIPYKDGYIFINTFEKISSKEAKKLIVKRLEECGITAKEYIIGVSSLYKKLGELNNSIKESMYSFKYSIAYKKDISFFDEIGVNKILIPLIDNPWVLKYYNEIIEPLIVYDENNDTELLRTAVKYIENNGDIKTTAKELFQHSNTIRYRIERINKILNENYDNTHFYEELAVAIRIYNLLNNML
ncbi:PucR family transcriptional regulator [Clostridium aciditolerans]|uniref:PucR family transcriptional regulator n=1 Tax=Clostridium aciditolerans TaxID=339861 RepID=A0A934HY19_9CLOT|nr:PucR family transcriptional regulator [Clostridium aciditolerans]MBI6875418.1 PucR family transcriptional regulator [Clostridium aciditolerans]